MTYKGAAIFFTDGQSVLLLKKSGIETNSGTWGFPGGHPKGNEVPWQTAKREAKEETGHLVDSNKFAEAMNDKYFVFFVKTKPFNCKLSKEHSQYKWVKFGDISEYKLHPKLTSKIKQYVQIANGSKMSFKEWIAATT